MTYPNVTQLVHIRDVTASAFGVSFVRESANVPDLNCVCVYV